MKLIQSHNFKAEKAWGSLPICNLNGVTAKLHWTDTPYHWHINDGEEVFAVMAGTVRMHYKENGQEKSAVLNAGDIFFASIGTEHFAEPIGEARILVVEKEDSI